MRLLSGSVKWNFRSAENVSVAKKKKVILKPELLSVEQKYSYVLFKLAYSIFRNKPSLFVTNID